MSITPLNPIKAYFKSMALLLLMSVVLTLTACEDKPDYEVKRLRVDAITTNISGSDTNPNWKTGWRMEFQIANNGGEEGLGPDANGFPHAPIPILFTASIPNDNLNGCPSQSTNDVIVYDGPTHRTLLAWREVPVKSGPIYSFPNVFVTDTNPPKNCVAEKIKIDWDAKKPDFESTVEESNEVNNGLIVDITNWPHQKVWVKENF